MVRALLVADLGDSGDGGPDTVRAPLNGDCGLPTNIGEGGRGMVSGWRAETDLGRAFTFSTFLPNCLRAILL